MDQRPEAVAPPEPATLKALPMFRGSDGGGLSWDDLAAMIDQADVIILGELHDDAAAHGIQQLVVAETTLRYPGSGLSMEMLERDEQPLVDDYFDGIIDAEGFAKLTESTAWAGPGSWERWYQPSIDAARDNGARVIAANAPRRYVRIARTDGWERLETLPAERRGLFAIPPSMEMGEYRRRFDDVMSQGHGEAEEESGSAEPQAAEEEARDEPYVPDPELDAGFRSQLTWDATMAESIALAREAGMTKVIHLVGQFHSDFDGGTVRELRRLRPGDRVLTISMQRETAAFGLREEDRGRADVVIYTAVQSEGD